MLLERWLLSGTHTSEIGALLIQLDFLCGLHVVRFTRFESLSTTLILFHVRFRVVLVPILLDYSYENI